MARLNKSSIFEGVSGSRIGKLTEDETKFISTKIEGSLEKIKINNLYN